MVATTSAAAAPNCCLLSLLRPASTQKLKLEVENRETKTSLIQLNWYIQFLLPPHNFETLSDAHGCQAHVKFTLKNPGILISEESGRVQLGLRVAKTMTQPLIAPASS